MTKTESQIVALAALRDDMDSEPRAYISMTGSRTFRAVVVQGDVEYPCYSLARAVKFCINNGFDYRMSMGRPY